MGRIVGLNVGLGLVDRRLSRLRECVDRKLRVAPGVAAPRGPQLAVALTVSQMFCHCRVTARPFQTKQKALLPFVYKGKQGLSHSL